MSSNTPPLRRRRLPQLLGIGLSAAALAGLVHFESVWAHADREDPAESAAMDELDELDELDERAPAPGEFSSLVAVAETTAPLSATLMPAAAESKTPVVVADASAVVAAEAKVDTDATAGVVPDVVALVTVPDLKGLNLRKARKRLKAVGLKMSVRDSYNERLPREYWSDYKVRRQKIEAGTEVQPGTRVRVKARFKKPRFAKGY